MKKQRKQTVKQTQGENAFLLFPRFSFSPLAPHLAFAIHYAQSLPVPWVRWWVVQKVGLVHDGFLPLLLLPFFLLPPVLPLHLLPACLGFPQPWSLRGWCWSSRSCSSLRGVSSLTIPPSVCPRVFPHVSPPEPPPCCHPLLPLTGQKPFQLVVV